MSIDYSRFHELFFEEADDCLAKMDGFVSGLTAGQVDAEAIVVGHRMAHTIRGNAATVMIEDIAGVAGDLESLLRGLKGGTVGLTEEVVRTVKEARDVIRGLVNAKRADEPIDTDRLDRVREALKASCPEP